MTSTTNYYLHTVTDAACEDGVPRRLEIHTVTAPVGVTFLDGVADVGGLVRSMMCASPLDPAVSSNLTVRWRSRFAAVTAADFNGGAYGDVVGVVKEDRDNDGTYETTVYVGYLVPGRFTSYPGDPLGDVDLAFNCGLGLLTDRAAVDNTAGGYDPTTTATLLARLAAWLDPIASAEAFLALGVTSLLSWSCGGETDVTCADGAFEEPDGQVDAQDTAFKEVAGRAGARLFQAPPSVTGGKPAWHLVERAALAAGLGGASYTAWDPLSDGGGVRDLSVAGVREESEPTVVFAEVERRFREPLDDLLVNGSFEDGTGTGPGSTITGWTLGGAAQRRTLAAYDPEATDLYALALPEPSVSGGTRSTATQTGLVLAVAGSDSSYSLDGFFWMGPGGVGPLPTLAVRVGAHPVRRGVVQFSDALKGDGVAVPCRPVLKSTTGFATSDADAVPGAVIASEGTTLAIGSTTLRLTEPLRVGDAYATGDLRDSISSSPFAYLYYFGPGTGADYDMGEPSGAVSGDGSDSFRHLFVRMPATDCTGSTIVGGLVRFVLTGPDVSPPEFPGLFEPFVRGLRLGLLDEDGRHPRGSVTSAVVSSTRGEGERSLPLGGRGFTLGDGPRPDSRGALSTTSGVTGPSGGRTWASAALDTAPGGPYVFSTLDEMTVASVLAQFGGAPAPRVWDGRLLLRSGARYDPWRPMNLSHPDTSAPGGWRTASHWWDALVQDYTAGTLDVRATALRLADVSGIVTAYQLTA